MRICIFEDNGFRNLLPLAWTRPVYFLKCGVTDLVEKITAAYPEATLVFHCRKYLTEITAESTGEAVNNFIPDKYLLINGRVICDPALVEKIDVNNPDHIYRSDNCDVAAVLSEDTAARLFEHAGKPLAISEILPELPVTTVNADVITYLWDIIRFNEIQLTKDFYRLRRKLETNNMEYNGIHLVNEDNIFIGAGAAMKPGVVLDAEHGPIYVDDEVTVMPNAVIEGPAYIGKKSTIKSCAKIYGGTTIGELCKVGGEVENSIIHSYSNKQHDGFLGHSYIGQWVNLGAGTNNSDLKNNYRSIKVTVDGEEIDSGLQLIGLFMGDHSKSGINTMFNTGTVVGVHCNVFGSGFPRKYIPSFSWGGSEKMTGYDRGKAVETAKIVLSRRNMELSASYQRIVSIIYDKTAQERARLLD